MPTPLVVGATPSIFNRFLAELRDEVQQQDRFRFRLNVQRAAQLLAYELSKLLPHHLLTVTTPLGTATQQVPAEQPVLIAILRAALPMQEGFLSYFDNADCGFVSAYRKHAPNQDSFEVQIEYLSSPRLEGRTVVLLDPMIATGKSLTLAYQALQAYGTPAKLFICALIASQQGLDALQRHLPHAQLIVGVVDAELTARGYIVPGLGDAGDLSYGPKR